MALKALHATHRDERATVAFPKQLEHPAQCGGRVGQRAARAADFDGSGKSTAVRKSWHTQRDDHGAVHRVTGAVEDGKLLKVVTLELVAKQRALRGVVGDEEARLGRVCRAVPREGNISDAAHAQAQRAAHRGRQRAVVAQLRVERAGERVARRAEERVAGQRREDAAEPAQKGLGKAGEVQLARCLLRLAMGDYVGVQKDTTYELMRGASQSVSD